MSDLLSPLMTSIEAAVYLRFVRPDGRPDLKSFHAWVVRYHIPKRRRGRRLLFERRALDRAIGITEDEPPVRRTWPCAPRRRKVA